MNRYYRQDTAPADLPGLLAKASVGIAGLWERDEGPAAAPHKYDVADSPYYKFVDVYNLKSGGSLLLLEKYKTKQQETGYTCGPAAAFTVAQYFLGTVPENEKEIAKIMGTQMCIRDRIGLIGVDGARYESLEFTGPGVQELDMADRFTICNMAIEAGGKNGIFPVDDKTREFLKDRVTRPWKGVEADPDAVYERVISIDLSKLEPVVAYPHLPENTHPVGESHQIPIDQVVIGSCTNGRLEDLAQDVYKRQGIFYAGRYPTDTCRPCCT